MTVRAVLRYTGDLPCVDLGPATLAERRGARLEELRALSAGQPAATLASGAPMPLVGFGTWDKGTGPRPGGQTRDAVLSALLCGYR